MSEYLKALHSMPQLDGSHKTVGDYQDAMCQWLADNYVLMQTALQVAHDWNSNIEEAPLNERFLIVFNNGISCCADITGDRDPEDKTSKRWFRSDQHGALPIDEIDLWMPLPKIPTPPKVSEQTCSDRMESE